MGDPLNTIPHPLAWDGVACRPIGNPVGVGPIGPPGRDEHPTPMVKPMEPPPAMGPAAAMEVPAAATGPSAPSGQGRCRDAGCQQHRWQDSE